MDFNETMLSLLKSLEEYGFDKEKIENELDYSPNYIGQQISKGGNETIVKSLQRLLQKAKSDRAGRPVDPNERLPMGDLKITLKDHFDLLKEHASIMKRIVEAKLLEPTGSHAPPASTEETPLEQAQRKYAGMIGDAPSISKKAENRQLKKKGEKKLK